MPEPSLSRLTSGTGGGYIIAVCACCTAHDKPDLGWEVVTCPICGRPCSCKGCVAECP